MKRYFNALIFLSILFISPMMALNQSDIITKSYFNQAETWLPSITSFTEEQQLAFLNFFALYSQKLTSVLAKCTEYIESQTEMLSSYKQLTINALEKYKDSYAAIKEKIARKKNLTESKTEEWWQQQVENPIKDMALNISAAYYKTLYNHILAKGSPVVYMFDENGLIPQENRTQPLPQPE